MAPAGHNGSQRDSTRGKAETLHKRHEGYIGTSWALAGTGKPSELQSGLPALWAKCSRKVPLCPLQQCIKLAGWLTGWLAGWLAGRLALFELNAIEKYSFVHCNYVLNWLAGWLAGWLAVPAGWLVGWLAGSERPGQPAGWLAW